MTDIGEILMIVKPLPGLRVLEVGCGGGLVTRPLASRLADRGGEIDLFEYAAEDASLAAIPNVKAKFMESLDKTIQVISREYETVVVTLLLNKIIDPKKLLDKCYHSLENSGTFLALCREGEDDPEAIGKLLDEAHFVAMNTIGMKEGYFLATAKKLHHWGRGL